MSDSGLLTLSSSLEDENHLAERRPHIAVLISGRGTNLQALIDAQAEGRLSGKLVVVISNNPDAHGLIRAKNAGIETVVIPHQDYSSREEHDRAIIKVLKQNEIDLVVLAGYMRLLTPMFVKSYRNRIINIHPALLPAFPGLHAQKKALDYGVRVSGCTTHFVDEGTDTGPIILQKAVPVYQWDTEESLAARILEKEHEILVESVNLFCEGRLVVKGRKVFIDVPELPSPF